MLERPRSALAGLAVAVLFVPACAVYDESLLGAPLGGGGSRPTGGSGGASALPIHFDSTPGQGGSAPVDARAGIDAPSDTGGAAPSAAGGAVPSDAKVAVADAPSDAGAGATGAPPPHSDASDAATVSMIDDMEDDNALILPTDGRTGYWYASNDGSATQWPKMGVTFAMAAGGHGSGKYAVHTSGGAFTGWGALVGFDFDALSGQLKKGWDASAYRGISFWAKAQAASTVVFSLPDTDTDPAGKVCVLADGSDKGCFDHVGTSIAIGTSWTAFSVDFDSLHQKGFGEPFPSLDKAGLVSCQWMVAPGVASANNTFTEVA